MQSKQFFTRIKTVGANPRAGRSVALRRVWFADDGLDAPNADERDARSETGNDRDEPDFDSLPPWAQEQIKSLRAEAAQRRIALKTAEEEARKRDQARLAEQGRWKELAEAAQKDLERLKPYEERTSTLEGLISQSNQKRIERIRPDMRDLVPTDYSPERLAVWLDANLERLSLRPAPDLDAGAGSGGNGGGLPKLTAEEIEMARRVGMTPEQYAKQKARFQR